MATLFKVIVVDHKMDVGVGDMHVWGPQFVMADGFLSEVTECTILPHNCIINYQMQTLKLHKGRLRTSISFV
jgi:hypothetical protein